MTEPGDGLQTHEVKGSKAKLLGLALLGVLMTGTCLFLVWPGSPGQLPSGDLAYFIMWIGVVFFGGCTLLIASRLFGGSEPVVVISPEGIRDTRVASGTIPWPAIGRIGTWSMSGQQIMTLDIDPEFERTLDLTRMVRMTRGANAKLGVPGLAIAASGLDCTFDQLLGWTVAHAEAYQARADRDSPPHIA